MNPAAMPLDADAMRLIAEIGFMGLETNQLPAARALFESLMVLRPDSTLPYIGVAMVDLNLGRPDDAVRMLRDEALPRHPGDSELMAFLGLALHAADQKSEAWKVLSSVVVQEPSNSLSPHVRLAAKLLSMDKVAAPPAALMPRWSQQALGIDASLSADSDSEQADVR